MFRLLTLSATLYLSPAAPPTSADCCADCDKAYWHERTDLINWYSKSIPLCEGNPKCLADLDELYDTYLQNILAQRSICRALCPSGCSDLP